MEFFQNFPKVGNNKRVNCDQTIQITRGELIKCYFNQNHREDFQVQCVIFQRLRENVNFSHIVSLICKYLCILQLFKRVLLLDEEEEKNSSKKERVCGKYSNVVDVIQTVDDEKKFT